jgi:hypothetical protein
MQKPKAAQKIFIKISSVLYKANKKHTCFKFTK